MKEIKLTMDKVALVDDEDFEFLNQFKWHARKNKHTFYASRREKGKYIHMHRLLLQVDDRSIDVDHRDGNGLHDFKSNLRLATRVQNSVNSRKQKNCTSEFKGVSWSKIGKKWIAYIQPDRKQIYLGYFSNEQDAARAYNEAATKLFGEFASLNKIA